MDINDHQESTERHRQRTVRQTTKSPQRLARYISSNEPLLVPDQAATYQIMLQKVQSGSGGIAFLDAPGGTR